ncbi:MAG: signal peptidase I [Proteobacteria bacterium]|nr:signal peptidase I [Pseudomonadota bacterium]
MSDTVAAPAEEAPKPYAAEIVEIAKTIGAALLIALVLRIVLFQPFTIPSDSMEPGLLKGDYLIVSKFSYGWSRFSIPFSPPLGSGRLFDHSPLRGDVVVFSHKLGPKRMDYVKRLIGLPGDRVQVISGVVHINGKPVRQELLGPTFDPDDPGRQVMKVRESLGDRSWIALIESPDHVGETTGVYVVPKDRFFFMGDNRDNSLDSRWPDGVGMGFVPKAEVEGRARFILVSWTGGAELFKPWTWVTRLDLRRLLKPIR